MTSGAGTSDRVQAIAANARDAKKVKTAPETLNEFGNVIVQSG
jgi:hypothetical protein